MDRERSGELPANECDKQEPVRPADGRVLADHAVIARQVHSESNSDPHDCRPRECRRNDQQPLEALRSSVQGDRCDHGGDRDCIGQDDAVTVSLPASGHRFGRGADRVGRKHRSKQRSERAEAEQYDGCGAEPSCDA
jgi:hypothetical protein